MILPAMKLMAGWSANTIGEFTRPRIEVMSGVPAHWRSPDTLGGYPPITVPADEQADCAAKQVPGNAGIRQISNESAHFLPFSLFSNTHAHLLLSSQAVPSV